MASLGIGDDTTVVGYDDAGGVIAARLVWMLRAIGHDAALLDGGLTAGEIVGLREADVLDTSDARGLRLRVAGAERVVRGAAPLARAYLQRRERAALPGPWLITDLDGQPVQADGLDEHLHRTRRQRVSMTFNALMCRGLLETRYALGKEAR
jgi:hypothetical protein